MRKGLIALFATAMLISAGCGKDGEKTVDGGMMTFTGCMAKGVAKTEIDDVVMKWSTDDKVVINTKECHSELSGDHLTAVFTGEVEQAAEYEAYYPSSLYKEGKYKLPVEQTYAGNTLSGVLPMYAKSTTTDLQFHNICAIVRLVVTGTGTVKTIKVTADKPLSGEFEISGTAAGGYYAAPQSTSADDNTVTLNCGGVILDETTPTIFYVALPQGEYLDLRIDLNGISKTSTSVVSMKLYAGKIYTKELTDVTVLPDGALKGVFSVSATSKVYFSKGNLQATYNGSKYDWGFAENQWNYIGDKGNHNGNLSASIANPAVGDVIDLFCWSTDASKNNYGIHAQGTSATSEYVGGSFKDWGENIGDGNIWRTLNDGDNGEWSYLVHTRGGESAIRFAKATVNDVTGLIIVPNNWSNTEPHVLNSTNAIDVDFTDNIIDLPTWNSCFESAGCLFLPAAGSRIYFIGDVQTYGSYWSSTVSSSDNRVSYRLGFNKTNLTTMQANLRGVGFSVRLVCPAGN